MDNKLPSFKLEVTETNDEIIIKDTLLGDYIRDMITEYHIKKDEMITKAILKRMPTTTLQKTLELIKEIIEERINNDRK